MSANAEAVSNKKTVASVMAALLLACFAFQLNASMLSPALVIIGKELQTDQATIALSQTVFFTAAALFSLFLPRLGDMMGRRRLLSTMMLVTAIGCTFSALSGVFTSVPLLFIGRAIQGIAGPTVPLCLIMLRVAVPNPRQYATLMGVLTAVNGGIAGVDALAGGWLAQNWGFASIFWTMAVIALIAAAAVFFGTDESTVDDRQPMDWLGILLLVIAVGAALIAVNEMGKLGSANWIQVLVLVVVAAVAFVGFWKQEDRNPHPLVTTTYLRSRNTWALLLTTVLTMTGVFAVMNGIVPAVAQDPTLGAGLHADTAALLTLTPYAIAGLIMGPISGMMAGRIGYRNVLRIGMIGTLIGLVGIWGVTTMPKPVFLLVLSIFVGITYAGMVNIMLNGLGIVLSPADNPGYLPGLNAGAFNLGAGLSFALLYAIGTAVGGGELNYGATVITGAILIGLALLASMLIPRPADIPAEEAAGAAA